MVSKYLYTPILNLRGVRLTDMKVVIIAAGMGTRLLHLTKDTPKCMVKVRGKPILEHQLDVFHSFGITDICIIKGYLKEQINYPHTRSYYNDDYKNNDLNIKKRIKFSQEKKKKLLFIHMK